MNKRILSTLVFALALSGAWALSRSLSSERESMPIASLSLVAENNLTLARTQDDPPPVPQLVTSNVYIGGPSGDVITLVTSGNYIGHFAENAVNEARLGVPSPQIRLASR